MIKLSKERVMLLHNIMTRETGGSAGLRDADLLDSALESAYQTFGGQELYPTVEEKGAHIGYSLIANHAFVDGNKRIGMLTMMVFLELNGVRINPTNESFFETGIGVAAGQMKYEDLCQWIRDNKY